KIIDCLTVSQAETANLGDACANESFYGQFVGKTEADYTEIDAISGATLTTNGYKQAIGRAFECVKIFEGVNS
ncbi:MAG: FMN-binding protein, partial [Clostridia bacterium]|nr:FMN-binding protein [Clostridia bacterium]